MPLFVLLSCGYSHSLLRAGSLRSGPIAEGGEQLGHLFLRGPFQQFVDEGLVGLGLFGGEAAELRQQLWINTDGDELLSVTCSGPSDPPGALQFFVSGFGNVGEI